MTRSRGIALCVAMAVNAACASRGGPPKAFADVFALLREQHFVQPTVEEMERLAAQAELPNGTDFGGSKEWTSNGGRCSIRVETADAGFPRPLVTSVEAACAGQDRAHAVSALTDWARAAGVESEVQLAIGGPGEIFAVRPLQGVGRSPTIEVKLFRGTRPWNAVFAINWASVAVNW